MIRLTIAVAASALLLLPSACGDGAADGSGWDGEAAGGEAAHGTGSGAGQAGADGNDCPIRHDPGWSFSCTQPLDCEEQQCGSAHSPFDRDGCLRERCAGDEDCQGGERCYAPEQAEPCLPSSVECSDSGDSCTCAISDDCGGRYCVAESLIPTDTHPFIYFTDFERAAVRAKVLAPTTASNDAYESMATSGVWIAGSDHKKALTATMEELAFRYAIDPDNHQSFGENARTMLLDLVADPSMAPSALPLVSKPYNFGNLPTTIATTFDMIYPLLTPAEIATVVAYGESFCEAYLPAVAINGGTYQTADPITNSAISTVLGVFLLARTLELEGDSTHPELDDWISYNWSSALSASADVWNPDGSYAEGFGYASYGPQLFTIALLAEQHRTGVDYFPSGNVAKAERWFTWAWMASNRYPAIEDAHKLNGRTFLGHYLYGVGRNDSAIGRWAWDQIAGHSGGAQYSFWASPHLPIALWYPEHVTPEADPDGTGTPTSKRFRDNENQGTNNHHVTHPDIGTGSQIYLHNHWAPAGRASVLYLIKDEWEAHSHFEADGHISVHYDGEVFLQDYGYFHGGFSGSTAYFGCQDMDHNVITVQGDHFTIGSDPVDHTKHYAEPAPDGRVYGQTLAFLPGRYGDYAHGDHSHVWKTDLAGERKLLFVKAEPSYLIVADKVARTSGGTYEYNLHSPAPPSGLGTPANPLLISQNGRTLDIALVEPQGHGGPTTAVHSMADPVHNYRTVITQSGGANETVSFVAFMQPRKSGVAQPSAVTRTSSDDMVGAVIAWSGRDDRVLVRNAGTTMTDGTVEAEAEAALVSSSAAEVTGFIMGEGTLLHAGGTLLADTGGQPASVSMGPDSVEIEAATLSTATLYAPTATAVRLNGTITNQWTRDGLYITVTTSP